MEYIENIRKLTWIFGFSAIILCLIDVAFLANVELSPIVVFTLITLGIALLAFLFALIYNYLIEEV